jgi:beta-glucanase (GH16 family)
MRWRLIAAVVLLAALVIAVFVFESRFFQHRLERVTLPPSHPEAPAAPAPAAPGAPPAPPAQAPPAGPTVPMGAPFIDLFDRVNAERWNISDRPPSGDWQENEWRSEQLSLSPDGLVLTMSRTPDGSDAPLASGEIFSRGAYRYGYFEVRWRVPRGAGIVSGAFTYVGQEGRVRPQELDIEILGRDTRSAYLSYHVAGQSAEKIIRLPFDAADGFHNFAIEWSPRSVRWYIDDDMVWEASDPIIQRMTKPEQFMIDLWATEQLYRWAGYVDADAGPWRLIIACAAQAREYPGHSLCPAR